MTKRELIEQFFKLFEEDKETIKNNLLLAKDEISLDVSNEFYKIELKINIEKK